MEVSEASVVSAPREDIQTDDIKVFVHLAVGQDVDHWKRLAEAGKLVGFNGKTPYGYDRAEEMGCKVDFARARKNSKFRELFRLGLRVVLGFDLLHAADNMESALKSDIIWTHTESQYLAIALMMELKGLKKKERPLLLGQSVWMIDKWKKLDPFRKAFYKYLIKHYVDILTFHSPLNTQKAQEIFPDKPCELVRYGIATEQRQMPKPRSNTPHRIICVGNDRHRDWTTTIAAFRDLPDVSLRIFTTKTDPKVAAGIPNVEIKGAKNDAELKEALATATLLVLPLIPNLHASGSTVIQEAAMTGIPAIVSKEGGLDAYFSEGEVTFVESRNPEALREAAYKLLNDPDLAYNQALRAYQRIDAGEIGAEAFVRDHVRISRELLSQKAEA